MELLVQLIFIIAILKYCLKASFAGGVRTMLLYALGAAVWSMAWYPVVIEQHVTIIGELLTDRQVVSDGAVWTTIEALAGILLGVNLLDSYFAPKDKRKKTLFILKIIPGVLAPLGLLYFELMFFKMRVSADFLTTALLYAVITLGVVFCLAWIIHRVVDGESMKLELKLLLNMMILLIGLLINSAVADYNTSAADTQADWLPLVVLVGASALLVLVGYLTRNWNIKHFLTSSKRWTK